MSYNELTKKDQLAFISRTLRTDAKAIVIALQRLYALQTRTEKETTVVRGRNLVGFTPGDVKELSAMAEYYQSRGKLSVEQMSKLRRAILKYVKQVHREGILDDQVS